MADIPTIPFGDIQVTRLISGGNPLVGCSHAGPNLDSEMCAYFTDEQVVNYLHACQAEGINTLQARGDYHRILHWVELFRREGGQLHWIAQTASEMHDVHQNIRILAAAGVHAIYHHGTKTDSLWHEGKIDEVEDYLKCMRDSGVMVGLGTHMPEVIEHAEEHDWDVDFYMACMYNISRQQRQSSVVSGATPESEDDLFSHEDDPALMCKVIRSVEKTCLAFKILGAGRRCKTQDDIREAFTFVYESIKPTDAVVVGMFPKHSDQIVQNVQYAIDAMANQQTSP